MIRLINVSLQPCQNILNQKLNFYNSSIQTGSILQWEVDDKTFSLLSHNKSNLSRWQITEACAVIIDNM